MGKEQAMEKYLEVLLDKITEVEKSHDVKVGEPQTDIKQSFFQQWLAGALFEFMVPKFAIIGKYYGKEEEEPKENEEPLFSPNENTTTASILSDYEDAIDEENHSR